MLMCKFWSVEIKSFNYLETTSHSFCEYHFFPFFRKEIFFIRKSILSKTSLITFLFGSNSESIAQTIAGRKKRPSFNPAVSFKLNKDILDRMLTFLLTL